MNKVRRILWGVVLVDIGVLLVLNTLGIIKFDHFFSGFWTLFIIIPCFIGIFTEKDIDVHSINSRTNKQGIETISMSFFIGGKSELNKLIDKIRMIDSIIDIVRTTG